MSSTLDQSSAATEAMVRASLSEAASALTDLLGNQATQSLISQAGALIADALRKGGRVFSCGNGGSMCDAMHFAEELTGRYRNDRPAYAAVAISDASHLSCVGNDYGYERVFARYLEAHGRAGDVLLAISTSGTSKNVMAAVRVAQGAAMRVVGLTGRADSELSRLADLTICTPGGRYADRVQELHIKVIHILIELVEHHLAKTP
jgi:D-sedoheptulose 7-phosphate isomerase